MSLVFRMSGALATPILKAHQLMGLIF
jgi:hypothetical protein